jgi:uncharacterized membrane protein
MFDFHPETGAFLFLFLGIYFLTGGRPLAAGLSVLPLLTLKEDLALIVLVFAVLTWLEGFRQHARWLAVIAAAWLVATVFIAMPLIRGGDSDLTRRYSYLTEGSNALELLPLAVSRAIDHGAGTMLPELAELLASVGFLPLLSPLAFLAALPMVLVNGLSDHPQQARLDLHYAVPALSLLWLATLLALRWLTKHGAGSANKTRILTTLAGIALLLGSLQGFLTGSPFGPSGSLPALTSSHRNALQQALELIPAAASVNAQSAILPHLSERRHVFEFPDKRHAEYVIVDSGLPISGQSQAQGYGRILSELPARGFERIYDKEGVQVWHYRR